MKKPAKGKKGARRASVTRMVDGQMVTEVLKSKPKPPPS